MCFAHFHPLFTLCTHNAHYFLLAFLPWVGDSVCWVCSILVASTTALSGIIYFSLYSGTIFSVGIFWCKGFVFVLVPGLSLVSFVTCNWRRCGKLPSISDILSSRLFGLICDYLCMSRFDAQSEKAHHWCCCSRFFICHNKAVCVKIDDGVLPVLSFFGPWKGGSPWLEKPTDIILTWIPLSLTYLNEVTYSGVCGKT